MQLLAQIESDLLSAVKSKSELTVSVLRMIKSAIINAEIAKGANLEEGEILAIFKKQAKQRQDSADQYVAGGRQDLAEQEEKELKIIEKYLPKGMDKSELTTVIDKVIFDLKADSAQQMGLVIKEVLVRTNGQAEGKEVSDIVRGKLT